MPDVIVIGGGPAGLQAALTLGRMHHDTVLFDSGEYRNAPARAMHNLAAHDGWDPEAYRSAARDDLARYATVELRAESVVAVAREGGVFAVETATGRIAAQRLILATGVRDTLPPVEGIEELWGDEVAHCPYCHGHEFAGGDVALLGAGDHAARVTGLLERIAASVTVLPELRAVRRSAGGLTATLPDGSEREFAGLFVGTTVTPSAPFAEQLGARRTESGFVEIDRLGRTSIPGLYAAGDLAQESGTPGPMSSVLMAAAAGAAAAVAIDADRLSATASSPRR